MINCNEKENDNAKQILQSIELDIVMDKNIQNIACLCKITSICNKQHLSNYVSGSIHEKVKQH